MNIYRFVGHDAQRAIAKANEVLGSEALIYSTRRVAEGIEVLAGNASTTEMQNTNDYNQVAISDGDQKYEMIEKLNQQLQSITENIHNLSLHLNSLCNVVVDNVGKDKPYQVRKTILKGIANIKKQLKEGVYGHQANY